jgi:hypothetical protein
MASWHFPVARAETFWTTHLELLVAEARPIHSSKFVMIKWVPSQLQRGIPPKFHPGTCIHAAGAFVRHGTQ